ncbi:MAG: hypothetical protein AAF986_02295, partial [Pseudomonadota bacterium]
MTTSLENDTPGTVSEVGASGVALGFGASGAWGQRWFSEAKAERIIRTALTQNIRHFDTAGFYCG